MSAHVLAPNSAQTFTDDVTDTLLRIAAAIRSGEIIGLTVVTTTNKGKVEMDALLQPGSTGLSKKY